MAAECAVPLQKTHRIVFEPRRLCYPWHPWYGHSILTRAAGGAHTNLTYFCKLPEAPLDAMLVEIPRWMFDAVHCATMRAAELPHVDCATLRALKSTIAEQRASVNTAKAVINRRYPGKPVTETLMATIPRQPRTAQLALFGQRLAAPQWHDLAEATRAELVRLLAQLLLSVHTDDPNCAPRDRGARDE